LHEPQFDSPQYDSTQYDSTQYDSTQYDSTQYDSTQYDSTQFDSTQFDSTQFDSTQFDSTQYDSTGHRSREDPPPRAGLCGCGGGLLDGRQARLPRSRGWWVGASTRCRPTGSRGHTDGSAPPSRPSHVIRPIGLQALPGNAGTALRITTR